MRLLGFAVTHRLSQSLFTRKVQSQRTLIISRNPLKHYREDAKQQFTTHPTHPAASSKTLLCFSSPALLRCFPRDRAVSKAPRLMNSRQLVGLKFIDRTATSPSAFLPGRAALIVQSVRSICYWAAPLAWQQRAGSITAIAWWLRREQRGHAC